MIRIRNLYKRYHNHHGSDWILKNIDLTIPTGVSVGLVGSNGAGKSTLLRLIADMDAPDKGEIIRNCRVSWPIGLSGGFQGSMTGRQNVKFVARIHGDEKNIERIVAYVEDFAEIGPAFDEPLKSYSSGMKSRLAFGLSLAFDFDVYLSDEATAVGDLAFKEKAKNAFKKRVGQAGLIMVSHSEGILKDLCQAGIWLHEGRAHWYDEITDAISAYHESLGLVDTSAIGASSSSSRMQTMREKVMLLRENQSTLREKNKMLRESHKVLQGKNKKLREKNQTLLSEYRTLQKRYKGLNKNIREARLMKNDNIPAKSE